MNLFEALGLQLWQFALFWLVVGWIIAGALVWFRQGLTLARLIVCLFLWPGVVIACLLGFLKVAAEWVFDPDVGPIAAFVGLTRALATSLPPARKASPS